MVKPDSQPGDNVLGNFLVNPGETPPTTCEPGNPDCTTNPVPQLEDSKSMDPKSGSTVVAGQELTYTLTFTNKGAAAGDVDRVDDLSKVLDDATITSTPTSSDAALVVSDGTDGKITIKGSLEAGKTVTVSYKVMVKPDGQRGDNVLGNFLVNPGETPPTTCEPGNPDCTTNPVPQLEDSKSVDPKSGTTVKAGQELTYTLTFENKGAGAGEINRVDNLTGVLDDATISAKPSSSDGALTVTDGSNGKIDITGTLDAGKTVTVTYKVTVKPDGQRGDNLLGHFLLNPGETPPTTCVPGSDKCTNNPVTPTPVVPTDPSLPDTGVQGLLPILYGAGGVFLLGLFLLLGLGLRRRRSES
ncbi:isopeptide-forming domain-containing fimbrial protein [Renibacterium salmoninarum]|nr:isopeptide-forming domain-containing fimbrial protein [Renibacterium salmoninarum]